MCENGHGGEGPESPDARTASASETGLWKLKFNTFYSYKWHAGLYRFWKFWEEATAILPVLLSLSVVGNAADKIDPKCSLVLAAVSTLLSLFSIAKGFGAKAAFYSSQSKRYLSLFTREELPDAVSKLNDLNNEFVKIQEDDREEGLDTYDISCYNKAAVKMGVPDACKPLSWLHKITMCFF